MKNYGRILVLDVESTINSHPMTEGSKCCGIGILDNEQLYAFKIEHGEEPFGDDIAKVTSHLASCDVLVLFNGKFDLHWLRRYGVVLPDGLKVWDCQLFEFVGSNQQWKYPSLDESFLRRGLSGVEKYKVIEEYWDQGVDTPDLPWEMVEKRVTTDVQLTRTLFDAQYQEYLSWPKNKRNLFRLHCEDLLVLEDIEYNGFAFDTERSEQAAREVCLQLEQVDSAIKTIAGESEINLNSPDQRSVILYGGKIVFDEKIPDGVFKSGKREGQIRHRWVSREVLFPRLIEPLDGTGLGKEGYWSTDQETLPYLRAKGRGKKVLGLMQDRATLNTKLSRYLLGLPKLIRLNKWPPNMLYGSINQCVAVTGRTSSSKPNLQNMDSKLKHLFPSRFQDG